MKENSGDSGSKCSPDCEPVPCLSAVSPSVPSSPVSGFWVVNLCAPVIQSPSIRRIGRDILSEDFLFERLLTEASVCSACLLVAPHATFVAARRGVSPPEIYGLKDLSSDDKTAVRKETLVALRLAELARKMTELHTPWLLAAPGADGPSVFRLPEVRALLSLPGVSESRFDHSPHGFFWQLYTLGQCRISRHPTSRSQDPGRRRQRRKLFFLRWCRSFRRLVVFDCESLTHRELV